MASGAACLQRNHGLDQAGALLGLPVAAVFDEKTEESARLDRIGRVENEPSIAADPRKTRLSQNAQMRRHQILAYAERPGDRGRGQAFGSRLHQKPKNLEARFLRQR